MSWYQEHKMATWISVGVLIACLLAGGRIYFIRANVERKARTQQQSNQKTGPLRVKVVYPKQGGVERLVRRPATVQSFEYADLYAKVSGYLENQKVDIGSRVEEKEILATVYAPEKYKDVEKAEADVKKAEANVAAVNAHLHRAEADQRAAQAQYEQSQADVKKTQALVSLRRKQYKRYYKLAEEKALQWELVDERLEAQLAAEAAVLAAEKAVDTAYEQRAAAQEAVLQAKADIKNAEASVGVAQAVLDRAKVWADYTKISSPYAGVITKRNFHNGDFIREAGGGGSRPDPLLAVARTDKMRIIVQVPDRDVPYLKVGDKADLTIDTLPDRHFPGKVARMAYREVYETRTMRTEVDIMNPDELLEDGMYGEMVIHLGREKGLRVPSKCLVGSEKGKERSVYVVRDGRGQEVKVKVGTDDGIEATIRSGLSKSDQVIVERPPGLTDGMRVEVFHDRSEETVSEKQEKSK